MVAKEKVGETKKEELAAERKNKTFRTPVYTQNVRLQQKNSKL